MKMGYCGDVRRARTHLKCQVCEQGATKSDWQGCVIHCQCGVSRVQLHKKAQHTEMELRQMEQSWDVDEDLPAGPALEVIVLNRSWAAMLK
jgi:hypothetical protein